MPLTGRRSSARAARAELEGDLLTRVVLGEALLHPLAMLVALTAGTILAGTR